jgi:hypothetical protein
VLATHWAEQQRCRSMAGAESAFEITLDEVERINI